jgi:rubrerythrin
MSLTITNSAVIEFYEEYSMLDFEKMNILFVEILNKLMSEISPNMDSTFGLKIINEIVKLGKTFDKKQNENINNLSIKIAEVKKEYLNDLEKILNNNSNTAIKSIIMQYTEQLKENTKDIIVDNFNKHVNDVKTINSISSEKQDKIDNKLQEVLKKFDSSSTKGNMSEMFTYNMLKAMYSENQLKIVNTIKESGDILLTRPEKVLILIENKDKDKVSQVDVDKFIRDLSVQNCSGIFISHTKDIANKKPFEIGFYGKNIGIYIGTAKYNTDLIQIAIDIIDSIKSKYIEYDSEEDTEDSSENNDDIIRIDKSDLELLNKEYTLFVNNKLKHIKTIKDFSKKLIQEAEELNLETLNSIIYKHYGSNKNTNWDCKNCGYHAKNKGALASHMKIHKKEETLFSHP